MHNYSSLSKKVHTVCAIIEYMDGEVKLPNQKTQLFQRRLVTLWLLLLPFIFIWGVFGGLTLQSRDLTLIDKLPLKAVNVTVLTIMLCVGLAFTSEIRSSTRTRLFILLLPAIPLLVVAVSYIYINI